MLTSIRPRPFGRIRVGREQNLSLCRSDLQDLRIRRAQQPNVADMDRVVPCLFEETSDLGREVRVEEQLHAAGATTASPRS